MSVREPGRRIRRKGIRQRLLFKLNGRCPWCGWEMTLEEATIEHIIPLSKGGEDTFSNMALAHKDCNSIRSSNLDVRPLRNPAFAYIAEILDRAAR